MDAEAEASEQNADEQQDDLDSPVQTYDDEIERLLGGVERPERHAKGRLIELQSTRRVSQVIEGYPVDERQAPSHDQYKETGGETVSTSLRLTRRRPRRPLWDRAGARRRVFKAIQGLFGHQADIAARASIPTPIR